MKAKHLSITIVVLLVACGVWPWRMNLLRETSKEIGLKTPDLKPKPGQMLRPPDPNRKFREMTPEERVQLARRGPIGG